MLAEQPQVAFSFARNVEIQIVKSSALGLKMLLMQVASHV